MRKHRKRNDSDVHLGTFDALNAALIELRLLGQFFLGQSATFSEGAHVGGDAIEDLRCVRGHRRGRTRRGIRKTDQIRSVSLTSRKARRTIIVEVRRCVVWVSRFSRD